MGTGAGAGSFFGGLLGGIGEGLIKRRERQDKIKMMATQGAIGVLQQMASNPQFSGDPAAIQDLTNATMSVLQDSVMGGKEAKTQHKAGNKSAGNPLSHVQELVTGMMGKVYEGGQEVKATPQQTVAGTPPPSDAPNLPMPGPKQVPGTPGRPEVKGPFLSPAQIQERQSLLQRQKADQDINTSARRTSAEETARAPFKLAEDNRRYAEQERLKKLELSNRISQVPGVVEGSDPNLQSFLTAQGIKPDESKKYHVLKNGDGNVLAAFEAYVKPEPAPKKEYSGELGSDIQAQDTVDHPQDHTPSEVTAAKNYLTKKNRVPSTVINMNQSANEADDIATAIINGTDSPSFTNMPRGAAGKVRAILDKKGYNLKHAQEDWLSTQAWIRSMNSAGQTRLRQATQFANESLNLIDNPQDRGNDLIGKLSKDGVLRTKFPIFNKAALLYAKSGAAGEKAASAARMLEVQINDLQSELATVYKGGNSPTDVGMKRAMDILNENWSDKTLRDAVDLSRKNLTIRLNSMKTSPVIMGGGSGGGSNGNGDASGAIDNEYQNYLNTIRGK